MKTFKEIYQKQVDTVVESDAAWAKAEADRIEREKRARLSKKDNETINKIQDLMRSQPSKKSTQKEEVEQIDEVSKETLKSYMTKVAADSQKHPMDPTKRKPEKASKSVAGFAKAHDRLTKEEVEQVLGETFKKGDFIKTSTGEVHRVFDVRDNSLYTAPYRGSNGYGGKTTVHKTKATKIPKPDGVTEEVEQVDEVRLVNPAHTYVPPSEKKGDTIEVHHKDLGGKPDYKSIKAHLASKGLGHAGVGTRNNHQTVHLSNVDPADAKKKLGLKEEAEQIDELSKDTLDSYKEKRSAQLSQVGGKKPRNTLKSFMGVGQAAFKSAMKKEEVELDELNKSTLGSYIKKASKEYGRDKQMVGRESPDGMVKNARPEVKHKLKTRMAGIEKATDRLTKEETQMSSMEQYLAAIAANASFSSKLEEKHLTPNELKKREEIAKAMDKEHPEMPMGKKMAIATATAKKVTEDVELEEAVKLGTKVRIHAPGKSYHGTTGRIGEIRHGLFKGAPKTYTVDHEGGSIQLDKKNIRIHTEEVEIEEAKSLEKMSAAEIDAAHKEVRAKIDAHNKANPFKPLPKSHRLVQREKTLKLIKMMDKSHQQNEEVEIEEAMIGYSDFIDKVYAHRKAGHDVVKHKYTTDKASYTVIDKEGMGRTVTHTPSGTKTERHGAMTGHDDKKAEVKQEKRGRGRPKGSTSGARRHK